MRPQLELVPPYVWPVGLSSLEARQTFLGGAAVVVALVQAVVRRVR